VGLPRRAKKDDPERYAVNGRACPGGLGFEDVRDMKSGAVARTFHDPTLAEEPVRRTITYRAPFFKKNREDDYKEAFAFFEKKLQKGE